VNDGVQFNGTSYISTQAGSGQEPDTSGAFWDVLAQIGATGATGATGPAGPTGAAGAAGPQGATGATGPQGATGAVGPAGPTGSAGAAGPQGATGAIGPAGPTGAAGAAGPQGPTGATGPQGATGATGSAGATGPQGPAGPAGPSTFSAITSSTNTSAAMVVGTGASLSASGAGTINATGLSGPFGIPVSGLAAGSSTIASTTYGDLGDGSNLPAVAVTVSGSTALVTVTAMMSSDTAGAGCVMGFAINGVNPAADSQVVSFSNNSGLLGSTGQKAQMSATYLVAGLTAGSNTFSAKYHTLTGGTCTFLNRGIIAIPY